MSPHRTMPSIIQMPLANVRRLLRRPCVSSCEKLIVFCALNITAQVTGISASETKSSIPKLSILAAARSDTVLIRLARIYRVAKAKTGNGFALPSFS